MKTKETTKGKPKSKTKTEVVAKAEVVAESGSDARQIDATRVKIELEAQQVRSDADVLIHRLVYAIANMWCGDGLLRAEWNEIHAEVTVLQGCAGRLFRLVEARKMIRAIEAQRGAA